MLDEATDRADDVFKLVIYDHVKYVDPNDYGIRDFDGIDPRNYFITSGDAVIKSIHLERDLQRAARTAKSRFATAKSAKQRRFCVDLAVAARQARKLVATLKRVRGDHIFLECDWRNHELLLLGKDPRPKKAGDID